MINIIGKRYYFFLLSLLIIVPGMILFIWMAINGTLPLAIDFTGGALLEIKCAPSNPQPEEIITALTEYGFEDVKVQTTGEGTYMIRSSPITQEKQNQVVGNLKEKFSSDITVLRLEAVGPTIGQEVTKRALQAAAVAALIVTLFMTFALWHLRDHRHDP
jgi:preprotein translocase subunit SecF